MSTFISNITDSTTSSTATAKKSNTLGQEAFMTMLLAQLKNQNPLNPMDGTQFAVQLAQFSSLEQLSNLNTTMSTLPDYLKSFTNAQMVNMIGYDAMAKGNVVNVSGAATNISFSLPSDIQNGTIKIYNSNGSQVGSANLGILKAGINSVAWNTTAVAAGNYTFEISAVDSSGNAVTADALISGTVTGASYKDGTAYLTINGQEVALSNVVAINKLTN